MLRLLRRRRRPRFMYLKSLYLKNFRNFSEKEVEFSSGLNLIWGENARGKTNLLEAIALIATGRLFRAGRLSELIREKEAYFYLEAHVVHGCIAHTIQLSFDGKNKCLRIDATQYSSFSPLLGMLPWVLHTPQDSELIAGSPVLRRQFLNFYLAQSDPLYVHHLVRYTRAMKQRNASLHAQERLSLDCWEEMMADSAEYLHKARAQALEHLQKPLFYYSQLLAAHQEVHRLKYLPSFPQNYLEHLHKARDRDRQWGGASAGPHRDDLSFWIEERAARLFASEGQKKTAAAALRLAEWAGLSERLNCTPLIAVDDLGTPLDTTRQTQFLQCLKTLGQGFITTPSTIEEPSLHLIPI